MDMRWAVRFAVVIIMSGAGFAPQVEAASGAWTATGSGQVGNWTDDANWTGATYPGSDGTGQNAYLTNSTANTYTSILDSSIPNGISTLSIRNAGGGQAWLIVTNATLTNTTFALNTGGRLQIDNSGVVTGITSFTWNGVNGVMNINSGALYQTSGSTVIGDTAGSDGNRLTVNGGTVRAAAYIRVGHLGNGNTMVVSNATVNSVGLDIGWLTQPDSSSSNTVIVGTGTIWNVGGGNVNVGAEGYKYRYGPNSKATNSVLIVDGGVLTNASALSVYQYYSRLTVTNGGKVYLANMLWQGTTGNVVTVTGPGSYLKYADNFALSGYNGDGRASNALWIANGGVMDGPAPSFHGGQVTITGAGSTYSNAGTVTVDGNLGSILVDAGGKIRFTSLIVSGSSNTMTFSGSGAGLLRTPAAAALTLGGSYNSVTFSNGAALDIGFGNGFSVGNGSGVNYNSLNIGGLGAACACTGQYNDVVGGSGGAFNTLTVTNASLVRSGNTWGMTVGNASPSNTITVAAGGIWDAGAGIDSITVGSGAATGNLLQVTVGGVVSNLLRLSVGNGATASGNRAIVDGGSVFANSGPGYATPGVYVANGTDNQIIVRNGGLLEVGLDGNNNPETLSVAAGAGNLITNSGGIYQFRSVAPTITTNGNPDGSIFLNGGTLSFRGVGSGLDITDHLSAPFTSMTWSGDNALRINNSTLTSGLGYMFDTGLGATHWCRLEMVGGTNKVNGAGFNVGTNGAALFSNTVATIQGSVTNSGRIGFHNSTVTFKSDLVMQSGCALAVTSTNLLPIVVQGVLTLEGGNVTLPADLGRDASFTLFTSSNTIVGYARNLRMPPYQRAVMSPDSLSILVEPRQPGFVLIVK